jgi:hypothetical protein
MKKSGFPPGTWSEFGGLRGINVVGCYGGTVRREAGDIDQAFWGVFRCRTCTIWKIPASLWGVAFRNKDLYLFLKRNGPFIAKILTPLYPKYTPQGILCTFRGSEVFQNLLHGMPVQCLRGENGFICIPTRKRSFLCQNNCRRNSP